MTEGGGGGGERVGAFSAAWGLGWHILGARRPAVTSGAARTTTGGKQNSGKGVWGVAHPIRRRARNQIEAGVAARREAIAMGTTKTLAVWSTEGGEGLQYAPRAQEHSSACAGGRSPGRCVRERGRHAPCGMGCRAWGGQTAGWMQSKNGRWGSSLRGLCKEANWKKGAWGAGGGLLGPAGIIGKGEPCVRDEGMKGAKASMGRRGRSSGGGAARGKGGRAVHGLEV